MIPFSKYHGLGNDFILVKEKDIEAVSDLKDLIVCSCDRHTGVGADGFIIVRENPLEMVYYNQDGSRADMCGNGIRCFAAFCHDEGIETRSSFAVETLAGTKEIEVRNENPFLVAVRMGKPDFAPEKIATAGREKVWGRPFEVSGKTYDLYSFYMSTIHSVLFTDDAFADIQKPGRALCEDPFFQEQTNVNFVEVLDPEHIRVQTYERGCGVTLACGTGVCASAVAAYLCGKTSPSITAELKKGSLQIDLDDDLQVTMTGPARRICKGELDYA